MSTGLREWRASKGLSIRDLERLTGINRGRLSQIERGIQPSPAEYDRIAAALLGPGSKEKGR
jgi:transcriptional regulator with XRE-family HTH domain